ncbi:MAG: hypothetical protein EPN94_09225, partial [Nitrospirae bacterium]
MLELNFSNMMGEMIGEKGVAERQIEGIKTTVCNIDKRINSKEKPELAFIDLLKQDTSEIKKTASFIRNNFENFIILGIGGSALGPKAILEALSPFHNIDKKPRVFI